MNPIISKAANKRILPVIAAFYSLTRTMESALVRFSPRKHAPVCISAHMQKKRRVRHRRKSNGREVSRTDWPRGPCAPTGRCSVSTDVIYFAAHEWECWPIVEWRVIGMQPWEGRCGRSNLSCNSTDDECMLCFIIVERLCSKRAWIEWKNTHSQQSVAHIYGRGRMCRQKMLWHLARAHEEKSAGETAASAAACWSIQIAKQRDLRPLSDMEIITNNKII